MLLSLMTMAYIVVPQIFEYILSLINVEFSVYFVKDVYSYEEGDSVAEVCLEGCGETAQPVTVEVSSYVEGTATGTYTECTLYVQCVKREVEIVVFNICVDKSIISV